MNRFKATFLKTTVLLILVLSQSNSYAQYFQVMFDKTVYPGGYNITCNGAQDGRVFVSVEGGQEPYTYLWNTGDVTNELIGIVAGVYTVTITDASSRQQTETVELFEPERLGLSLSPSVYAGGYNISTMGGSDGSITAYESGGVPPYEYNWSNGGQNQVIDNLVAGSYSLSVNDAIGCSINQNITLTEPPPIYIASVTKSYYKGYNVSCNGGSNGTITLTVAGGTPPYTYQWSNGAFTKDLTGLTSGTYSVIARDANNAQATTTVTLIQPLALQATVTSPNYPNGYSTSCFFCTNGSITSTVSGGVTAYTYIWSNGQVTPNATGLAAGDYTLTVRDGNNCEVQRTKTLTSPQRDDWTMNGNTGSDPTVNFIGTIDNKDLVFKANNTEQLRLGGNGDITVSGKLVVAEPSTETARLGIIDQDGKLSAPAIPFGTGLCKRVPVGIWYKDLNCPTDPDGGNANANSVYSYPFEYKVGIGTQSPSEKLEVTGNIKAVGNICAFGSQQSTLWAQNSSSGYGLGIDENGLGHIYKNFTTPASIMIFNGDGKVGIGVSATSTFPGDFKLYVKDGIRTEKVQVDIAAGNWADFVFDKNYKLQSLSEVEKFIQKNKHLPDVPSETEVVENGIDLAQMNAKLLQKVEELTLYIIEMDKKVNALQEKSK